MSCPDLELLSGALSPKVASHVATCEACALVVELARERELARSCARFEDLLAVRGALPQEQAAELEAHLVTCVACRAIASTLAPLDVPSPARLPVVDLTSYAFGREVARGGMGRVVAAEDLRIGRPVAVKELLGSSPTTAARFEREARITARLQHPGIVPIYEIGSWPDGTPFYSMRLVEGKTLSAALASSDNRLELLPSVIAACEAIAFAHAHEVIHRDLKPSNIMVGAFGETVVIDWGLAKTLDEVDARDVGPYRNLARTDLTVAGEVMGTAAYMPPEQAHAEPVDRRADVYSLGAILYHLLAGHAPYQGTTSVEIVEKVRSQPPARLPEGTPRDLASIVAKAMARGPDQRYPDAGALAVELQRFQTGRLVEAHAYSRGERLRRWLRRNRAAVVASVAALVALAIAGGIGIAGVLRERDIATAHEQKQHAVAVALLEEQGRQELLAGHMPRALAYFDSAMQQGLDTPELRFMLARALPSIEGMRATYACSDAVTALAASETRIVAACGDHVRAWDPRTQREVFDATVANARSVAVAGETVLAIGDRAALLAPDGGVRWALGDNAVHGVLTGERAMVFYADGTARSWDTSTGRELARFGTPRTGVLGAASRDGRLIALGVGGEVELYDGATGVRRAAFHHGGELYDLSAGDQAVVACGDNGDATVWRAGAVQTIGHHHDSITRCRISPDGSRVILLSFEMRNEVWDVATGRVIAVIPGYLDPAEFSPDGKTIATGWRGITLWDAHSGAMLVSYERNAYGAVAFGGELVFDFAGPVVTAWTTTTAQQFSFTPPDGEAIVDASRDGSRLVTQRRDGTLAMWDTHTGQRVPHAEIRSSSFDPRWLDESALFDGDGDRLAAWNGRDAVLIVDARTGTTLASIPAPRPAAVTLDATGHRALIEDSEGARIWSDGEISALPGKFAAVLSPDGTRVVTWTQPGTIMVWDIAAQRAVGSLATVGDVQPIGFSRDLSRVVVSENPKDDKRGFVLFDVGSGARIAEMTGTTGSFSPDHERFTLTRHDAFVIWKLRDGTATVVHPPPPIGASRLGNREDLAEASGLEGPRIVSTRDGRVLWHWDRYQPMTTRWDTSGGVGERFSEDDARVLVLIGHAAAWKLDSETRDAAQLHALIAERVPLRERDGMLVATRATLRGRATRAGAPVANAEVRARRADGKVVVTRTRRDGEYTFSGLPVGRYELSAGGGVRTVDVADDSIGDVELASP